MAGRDPRPARASSGGEVWTVDRRREVRGVLAEADAALGRPAARAGLTGAGPAAFAAVLTETRWSLLDVVAAPGTPETTRAAAGAALARVERVRETMLRPDDHRSRTVLAAMADAMGRLRAASSTAALLERAPREVALAGYDRCMISRVHHGQWIAESSYVRGDAQLARTMVQVGSEAPIPLDRGLLESDVARTRSPILVRDAQRNPRTHRGLIDVTGTVAYVAAPIQVGRSVVGFLHVDTPTDTGAVDDGDVDAVALIAECLGYGLERVIQRERLQAARTTMASYAGSITAVLDDLDDDPDGPARVPPARGAGRDTVVPRGAPGPAADRLTRRELEVLERVAAGRGNVEIAADLFVTEATVKAHIKHIFRKLGVANRAEAVSRHLRG